MSDRPVPSYLFGPRSRRGVFGTLRASQLIVICSVLVVVVGLLRAARGSALGVGLSMLLVVASAAVFIPIRGRTLDAWAPVGARHLLRSVTANNGGHSRIGLTLSARRAPQVFAPFDILDVEVDKRSLALLLDHQNRTLSAVLAIGGSQFSLLDDKEKALRCAAWSDVLATLANGSSEVHRVQWISRSVPDRAHGLSERAENVFSKGSLDPDLDPARRSYLELLEDAKSSHRHEHFVVLTLRARRGVSLEGEVGSKAHKSLLVGEIASFARRCQGAGLVVEGVLSRTGLSAMVRRLFDVGALEGEASWPWPNGVEATWSHLRTDGLFHATYWVAEWPRSQVRCDFLLPLLKGASERRSISLVMAPVSPGRAARRVERDRTEGASDHELRRRHGFQLSARTVREHEAVLRREAELAEGHGLYRMSGYVTVSAKSSEALEASAQRVEQLGALARLELHRLYGDQAEAFCTMLPAGRGCT